MRGINCPEICLLGYALGGPSILKNLGFSDAYAKMALRSQKDPKNPKKQWVSLNVVQRSAYLSYLIKALGRVKMFLVVRYYFINFDNDGSKMVTTWPPHSGDRVSSTTRLFSWTAFPGVPILSWALENWDTPLNRAQDRSPPQAGCYDIYGPCITWSHYSKSPALAWNAIPSLQPHKL